jgi:hypothetical protein
VLQHNGFGIAAFIVALLALVSAVVPVLYLGTVVVAMVGLVLGIVALFQTQRRKGFALAGTVLSAVALIVYAVVVIVFGAPALVSAIGDQGPASGGSSSGAGVGPTGAGTAESEPATRDDPAPIGTTVLVDSADGTVDWEVTLGPPMLDADDVLRAYSTSTEPAPEGFQYAMVPVTVVYRGTEAGTPWADLGFDFVSAAGSAHSSSDSFAVAPQPLTDLNRLAAGEGGTGNVVVAVPSVDVGNGSWVVSTMLGDQYFFTAE